MTSAQVTVNQQLVGKIDQGLLILLGIRHEDSAKEAKWLAEKIANLRIFADANDKMNLSLIDLHLEALVVSQFTLYGNCLSGRRPDFIQAAAPTIAEPLYEYFCAEMSRLLGKECERGRFGARMQVQLVNDGPVTFIIEVP